MPRLICAIMLIFCLCVDFNRNNKLIQKFQVAYSNSHPWWVGCKNPVEGTLMGGDLVNFWLMEGVPPQPTHYGKHHDPKISPERLYHLNLFFCLAVQDYDWNLQDKFGYWLLLQFFSVVCPLKLNLCFYTFSNMFWHHIMCACACGCVY